MLPLGSLSRSIQFFSVPCNRRKQWQVFALVISLSYQRNEEDVTQRKVAATWIWWGCWHARTRWWQKASVGRDGMVTRRGGELSRTWLPFCAGGLRYREVVCTKVTITGFLVDSRMRNGRRLRLRGAISGIGRAIHPWPQHPQACLLAWPLVAFVVSCKSVANCRLLDPIVVAMSTQRLTSVTPLGIKHFPKGDDVSAPLLSYMPWVESCDILAQIGFSMCQPWELCAHV